MPEPTPTQRMAAGYAALDDSEELKRRAASHRPQDDAEADRLAKLDRLPLSVRLRLGYHGSARDAAEALAERENAK